MLFALIGVVRIAVIVLLVQGLGNAPLVAPAEGRLEALGGAEHRPAPAGSEAAQPVWPAAATPEAAIDAANQAIRGRFAYVGDCAKAQPAADDGKLCSRLIALRPADGLGAYMVDLVENSDPIGTWYFIQPVGSDWQVVAMVSADHPCPPDAGGSHVPWPE